MTEQNLKLELNKMLAQQQQWHDDFELERDEFNQREKHWWWQTGFWLVVGTVATTSAIIASVTLILK